MYEVEAISGQGKPHTVPLQYLRAYPNQPEKKTTQTEYKQGIITYLEPQIQTEYTSPMSFNQTWEQDEILQQGHAQQVYPQNRQNSHAPPLDTTTNTITCTNTTTNTDANINTNTNTNTNATYTNTNTTIATNNNNRHLESFGSVSPTETATNFETFENYFLECLYDNTASQFSVL